MRLFGWFRKEKPKERIKITKTIEKAIYHIDVYTNEGVFSEEVYEGGYWQGGYYSNGFLTIVTIDNRKIIYNERTVSKFEVVKIKDAVIETKWIEEV